MLSLEVVLKKVFTGYPDASDWSGWLGWEPALSGSLVRQGDEQLLQQAPHRPRLLRLHLHHLRPFRLHSSQRCLRNAKINLDLRTIYWFGC